MQPFKIWKPFKLTWPLRKQPLNLWLLLVRLQKSWESFFSEKVVIGQSSSKCTCLSVRTVTNFASKPPIIIVIIIITRVCIHPLERGTPAWIDPTSVCAWLILIIRVRSAWWDRLSFFFRTTLFSGPISWGPLCCSDSRAVWPAHLCFAFLIALMMSLTPVSWRIQVFRFRSRRVMPSIIRSILRCATASVSIIALLSVHLSQPYVITGKMHSSCIFLFISMLALRLLMMLSTLPKAAQPSAILFLMSGSRSSSSVTVFPS